MLKLEDFNQYKWLEELDSIEPKLCQNYGKKFELRAKEYKCSGDMLGEEVFNFCNKITVIPTKYLDGLQLSDSQLSLLRELVLNVVDPEIKARIADILWVLKKRDPEKSRPSKMARLAIESYLQSATNLENIENQTDCSCRLQRAAQLASLVDGKKQTEMCQLVVSHIEQLIDRFSSIKDETMTSSVMKILQDDLDKKLKRMKEDLPQYAKRYATLVAKKSESSQNYYQKRAYRQLEIQWYKIAEDKELERHAKLQLAEVEVWYAQQASLNNETDSYDVAAGRINAAISMLKEVEDAFGRKPDSQQRIQELHKQMLTYQHQSVSQMITFPILNENDFIDPEMQKFARVLVKDKSIKDALYILAFNYSYMLKPTYEDLQLQVQTSQNLWIRPNDQINNSECKYKFPISSIDSEGKTKAVIGDDKNDLENLMFQALRLHQCWYGINFIIPACNQIYSEHCARIEDLSFIFDKNLFIPEGREPLYAKGLIAGLQGDYVIATHLLIPQVENSLRYILRQNGLTASKNDIIQEDFTLGQALKLLQLENIFSKDLVFILKGLLNESMGSNLRNEVCHGLLDYDQLSMPDVSYFWWLTLYLCLAPTEREWSAQRDNSI